MSDLFRTAIRLAGDRAKAEDVVQEVYLQAWKIFHRYQPGTNCRAWLFTILFYCLRHQRRQWFRFPLVEDAAELIEARLTYTSPVPDHIKDEEILAALDRIPAEFRAVVLLVDVEEVPYKEAAKIVGIPIGTVMSRLSRGRKLLRMQLGEAARSHGIGKAEKEGHIA